MSWEQYIYFAMAAILLWAIGAWAAWKEKTGLAYTATIVGLVVFFSFILSMWISMERPPLRTMGETRLWYSFFLPLAGIIVYSRWKYKWIMPALQSPWFAPHVIVYMFAYAVLGAATVMAVYLLFIKKKTTESTHQPIADEESDITDNLVYVGLAFLTIGMLFGALWAKEAWGHYWSWDPKETWAAITWLAYLVYVHYRNLPHHRERLALWILIVSFVLLQMCWWGINYLPSAQGTSVHTYSMSE